MNKIKKIILSSICVLVISSTCTIKPTINRSNKSDGLLAFCGVAAACLGIKFILYSTECLFNNLLKYEHINEIRTIKTPSNPQIKKWKVADQKVQLIGASLIIVGSITAYEYLKSLFVRNLSKKKMVKIKKTDLMKS
ncbi:hypothetical protein KAH94_00830 [bacterium]|nr:hypothetical protein [bacterium]